MAPYRLALWKSPSASRRKSARNLLLVLPAFALIGGISVAAVWVLQHLQSARCPDGTFLVGSGQVATIFQTIPILMGSIGISFLAVNWVAHSIPPVRDFFDRDARQVSDLAGEGVQGAGRTIGGDRLRRRRRGQGGR